MFIGKWNKSVFLTYLGLVIAVVGMFYALAKNNVEYAFCCLIVAGICDLFDGVVARKCKRTEEEKEFGVELDSLVDVISFIALPISIFLAMGLTNLWNLIVLVIFAISGIARLAYFNIATAVMEGTISHFTGLPVAYSALVFPLAYFLKPLLPNDVFLLVFLCFIFFESFFQILKISIPKPKGIWYGMFVLIAIVMIVFYLL